MVDFVASFKAAFLPIDASEKVKFLLLFFLDGVPPP